MNMQYLNNFYNYQYFCLLLIVFFRRYKADLNMLKDLINDCGEFNEKTNLKINKQVVIIILLFLISKNSFYSFYSFYIYHH